MRYYEDLVLTVEDRSRWTLPFVLQWRASEYGDKPYLDVPLSGDRYSFRETNTVACAIGSGLLDRGHEPGDRLVIMLPNCTEYILAWFGSAVAGIVEVPINTAYRGTFLEHQLRTVAPTGVVVAPDYVERLLDAGKACATVRRAYVVGPDPEEVRKAIDRFAAAGLLAEPFDSLVQSAERPLPAVQPQDPASIFFTSGTTGLSKGVVMSHAHMYFFAEESACLTRLRDNDSYLSVGPLFHGNAQFCAAYPALLRGARFILRERFSASNWSSWIRESQCTVTNLIGVMTHFVWKQPTDELDGENELRCVWAVPTPPSIADRFRTRFGFEAFVENFGLTETSMPILTPYGAERPAGAAGLLVRDWFDIRLVNPETDEEVAPGEVGELVVRPTYPWTISSGYFGMPDRTAEALRNCWFHTGDGLRRDEEGWYYFVDRIKDSIRRRGENISSYELEQAILKHDAIADCAVIAVPADMEAGEDEVMAFVVCTASLRLTADEFWAFAERTLPYFAVPRYLRFIDALPKTPSGKIQKAELRRTGVDSATLERENARV